MARLCKHEPHKVISWIKSPKWSTNEILIDTRAVEGHENLLIRFSDKSPQDKYGWFYMSGKMVRRHKTQKNGNGEVYVVPLGKREEFVQIKDCEHNF